VFRDSGSEDYAGGGMLRLNMSLGCQLAWVRVRRLAPPDPVFEPVVLENALNADCIGGESLK